MRKPHTHAILARMVKFLSFRNWPNKQFVSDNISVSTFPSVKESATSRLADTRCEVPTSGEEINFNLFEKPFNRGLILGHVNTYYTNEKRVAKCQ